MSATSRRNFVKNSLGSLGMLLAPPGLLKADNHEKKESPLKIVCIGAHPDDPESGCGGTLAKFANSGHSVTIIYLTRGEAGIPDKTHDEAASIRTSESIAACKILNARPVFAGQIDGDSIVNNDWVNRIQNLLAEEASDLVFTHWPIDSHKDHQTASLLTMQAWIHASRKFPLYFFEVCTGEQTMTFHPTDYVDITDTREQKRQAVYCHQSQDPPGIYNCGHTLMEEFRGATSGFKAAEGFVRMVGKGQGNEAGF